MYWGHNKYQTFATDWYWGTHWICELNKMNDMGAISFHPHI